MKSICFTGHRKLSENPETLAKRLYQGLEEAIQDGAVNFYAGGALGFDTLASKVVLKLREKYPHIKLLLVLPCSSDEQTAKWKPEDRAEFDNIFNLSDSAEYMSEYYYNGCMKVRNARLVEYADGCFCYWDINNQRSGTGQTVRMAQNKGIKVVNFFKAIPPLY